MARSASLYLYAEQRNIDVDWFPLARADSLSIPLGNEIYGIAIDPKKIKSEADETVNWHMSSATVPQVLFITVCNL